MELNLKDPFRVPSDPQSSTQLDHEIDACHKRVVDLLKKDRKISRDLRKSGDMDDFMLLEQTQKEVKELLPLMLKEYSRLSLRRLCNQVVTGLPAELRFEIYDYLCADQRIPVCEVYSNLGFGLAWKGLLKGPNTWSFLRVENVGQDFLRDFSRRLYRTASFDFRSHFKCLDEWLPSEDRFGNQVSETVNRVQIDLEDNLVDQEHIDRTYMHNMLKGLFNLKQGADIAFLIKIKWQLSDPHWHRWKAAFRRIVKLLTPMNYSLRERGYNIQVLADPLYERVDGCRNVICDFKGSTWHHKAVYVFNMNNCDLDSKTMRHRLHEYMSNDTDVRKHYREDVTNKQNMGKCIHPYRGKR